jgi:uncharacterized protein (TIGR03089 family)
VTAPTVPAALADALRGDSAAPFLTWVGMDGARSELSLRTYENNLAKAANLLRDDADLGPGGTVALHLPVHWQTSVWLGACALVGATAAPGGDPTAADVAVLGPASLDLGLGPAPLTLATSLHPFGMPFTSALPSGVLDAATEVRMHGDRFSPYDDVLPTTPWLELDGSTWTQQQALEAAAGLAGDLGLATGGRLLLAATEVDATTVLVLAALPLALRGSVVLLTDRGTAPDRVAAAERCDAVLVR